MRARVTAKAGVAAADPGVEAVSEGEALEAPAAMDRVETDRGAVQAVDLDEAGLDRVVATVGASVPAVVPGPAVPVPVPAARVPV